MWLFIHANYSMLVKCTAVEVWEWISNFIPHIIKDVITYPCQLLDVSKSGPWLVVLVAAVSSQQWSVQHDEALWRKWGWQSLHTQPTTTTIGTRLRSGHRWYTTHLHLKHWIPWHHGYVLLWWSSRGLATWVAHVEIPGHARHETK